MVALQAGGAWRKWTEAPLQLLLAGRQELVTGRDVWDIKGQRWTGIMEGSVRRNRGMDGVRVRKGVEKLREGNEEMKRGGKRAGRQRDEQKTGIMRDRWKMEKIEGDEERPVSVRHYRY